MRVIAGTAKSIPLKTIDGSKTRPTTDRIKETLFNMIQQDICDCEFLDLFSGSGAIAIEAISRGAKKAVLVENNKKAAECICFNLEKTGLVNKAEVLTDDVFQALNRLEQRKISFDIIFMDPPYGKEKEKEVLRFLENSSLITYKTIIIAEVDLFTKFDYLNEKKLQIDKIKKYKSNCHVFIRKKENHGN